MVRSFPGALSSAAAGPTFLSGEELGRTALCPQQGHWVTGRRLNESLGG